MTWPISQETWPNQTDRVGLVIKTMVTSAKKNPTLVQQRKRYKNDLMVRKRDLRAKGEGRGESSHV